MTDEAKDEAQVEDSSADEPKGLRKQLGEAHAKIKKLEAKELKAAFSEAGLDMKKGLGKAIAKEYDGDISADGVRAYAKDEYGWEAQPANADDPIAAVIEDGQAKIDAAAQGAGSVPVTPTADEVLQKAEVEGDYRTTMAMKGNLISQQIANQNR